MKKNVFNNKVKKAKHLSKWQWFMSKVRKVKMKIHKSILKDLVYKYPDEAERHIYNIRLMQQQEIDEELGTFVIEKLDGTVYRFDDEVDSEADTDKIERIEFE